MKANEFVKLVGFKEAKKYIEDGFNELSIHLPGDELEKPSVISMSDLKRLVESHELVERLGGIETMRIMQKQMILNSLKGGMNISFDGEFVGTFSYDQLEQAIVDVESCQ